jgi:hypothetical protein
MSSRCGLREIPSRQIEATEFGPSRNPLVCPHTSPQLVSCSSVRSAACLNSCPKSMCHSAIESELLGAAEPRDPATSINRPSEYCSCFARCTEASWTNSWQSKLRCGCVRRRPLPTNADHRRPKLRIGARARRPWDRPRVWLARSPRAAAQARGTLADFGKLSPGSPWHPGSQQSTRARHVVGSMIQFV